VRRDRWLLISIVVSVALISCGAGAIVALWWSGSPTRYSSGVVHSASSPPTSPFPDFHGQPFPQSPTSTSPPTSSTTTSLPTRSTSTQAAASSKTVTTTAPTTSATTTTQSSGSSTTSTSTGIRAHYCAGSYQADQTVAQWPPPASAGRYVLGNDCKDPIGYFRPVTYVFRSTGPVWYLLKRTS
jgi:hypothetical protein